MQTYAKIIRLGELKQGVSERTGNPWVRQQVLLKVYHQNQDGTFNETNESIVADCSDSAILNSPQWVVGMPCHVKLFFSTDEWNGRIYQRCALNGFTAQASPEQVAASAPKVVQAVAPQPQQVVQAVDPQMQGHLGAALAPKVTDTYQVEGPISGGIQGELPF